MKKIFILCTILMVGVISVDHTCSATGSKKKVKKNKISKRTKKPQKSTKNTITSKMKKNIPPKRRAPTRTSASKMSNKNTTSNNIKSASSQIIKPPVNKTLIPNFQNASNDPSFEKIESTPIASITMTPSQINGTNPKPNLTTTPPISNMRSPSLTDLQSNKTPSPPSQIGNQTDTTTKNNITPHKTDDNKKNKKNIRTFKELNEKEKEIEEKINKIQQKTNEPEKGFFSSVKNIVKKILPLGIQEKAKEKTEEEKKLIHKKEKLTKKIHEIEEKRIEEVKKEKEAAISGKSLETKIIHEHDETGTVVDEYHNFFKDSLEAEQIKPQTNVAPQIKNAPSPKNEEDDEFHDAFDDISKIM